MVKNWNIQPSSELRSLGKVLSLSATSMKSSKKGHITKPRNLQTCPLQHIFTLRILTHEACSSDSCIVGLPLLLGVCILCSLWAWLWSRWLSLPLLFLLLSTYFQQFQLRNETFLCMLKHCISVIFQGHY